MASSKEPQLVPVFMPSLSALLVNAEGNKGAPLTEQEVLAIRDKSVCVMMPLDQAVKMDESRGYCDINPENCWDEWLMLRQSMGDLK